MLDLSKILIDGGILTTAFTAFVLFIVIFKPRLFLNKNDIPADILAAVPPRTEEEKRQSIVMSIPFFVILIGGTLYSTYTFAAESDAGFLPLYFHALAIIMMITLFDLVAIDWLLLNTITPRWAVYPGTEGLAGYKDYGFHARAHLKAFPGQLIGAAIAAGIVLLIT